MSELKHFGIPGQKWGVRRFQNPDGTLTEAGRKRYLKGVYKDMESYYNSRLSPNVARASSIGRNGYESLDGAGSWGNAVRKGKVSKGDASKVRQAAKESREYIQQKYGKEVFRAMQRSGVLGRPVDNFKLSAEETKRFLDSISGRKKNTKSVKTTASNQSRAGASKTKSTGKERVDKWDDVKNEANKLFNKYPQLKKDFGSFDQIDDLEFFEYVLDEYGIKADKYRKALNSYEDSWNRG